MSTLEETSAPGRKKENSLDGFFFFRWWSVIVTIAGIIGAAYVARFMLEDHERRLERVEHVLESMDRKMDRLCIALSPKCKGDN